MSLRRVWLGRRSNSRPCTRPYYPAVLAHAYATSGRYEDAIAAADSILEQHPDMLDVRLIRIGSCASLGRTEDARSSAEALIHRHPRFRLDAFAQTQPYQDSAQLDRVTEALRSAGLE